MYLPSKELLSLIFGEEILLVDFKNGSIAWVAKISSGDINIYELIHKCKAWALKNNYSLLSGFDKETNFQTCFINLGYQSTECSLDVWWDQEFTADTEAEAVFKACQYIMDIKGKEND